MRIWMINHYAAPPTMAGGTRHFNFARQLMQRGHEVTIIAANYNHFSHSFNFPDNVHATMDYSHDVPFVWIPTPAYRGNTLARFWNMLVFSKRILHKNYLTTLPPPDIIIGSSPHLFAALSAQLLARRFKKPFLLEIRDLWPESLIDLGRISKHHPLIKVMQWIERYLYKRATRIISLLPTAQRYFMSFGVDPKNILWLPNAIDTAALSTTTPNAETDQFTLMYAGAHGLANDLDTLLKAAKILEPQLAAKNIRICLVGEGPEKARLQAYAAQENLTNVQFLDAVSKNKIYSVLNQADAFLMLLKDSPVFRWGISPNKLFDYLMMARPIIFGVNTPYNPIEKVNAGLSIPPNDAEALAKAMYKLSQLSKTELQEMGNRGKDFVLEHHHLHSLTDALENLILTAHQDYKRA